MARILGDLFDENEVAVIDTATSAIVRRVPVGTYPYTTVMSADGSKVYVTNWGGKIPAPADFTDGMFPVVVDRRTGITFCAATIGLAYLNHFGFVYAWILLALLALRR